MINISKMWKSLEQSRRYYSHISLTMISAMLCSEIWKTLFHKSCRELSKLSVDIKMIKIKVHTEKLWPKYENSSKSDFT